MIPDIAILLPDGFSESCVAGWLEMLLLLNTRQAELGLPAAPPPALLAPGTATPTSALGRPWPETRPLSTWKGDWILLPVLPDSACLSKLLQADWSSLAAQLKQGVKAAAVCAGSFILAAAGALDGRQATTHWSLADEFRKLFPRVFLDTRRMIVDEGQVVTAGGISAWVDLFFYLAAKWLGADLARELGRTWLHDPGRDLQTVYETSYPLPSGTNPAHEDAAMQRAEDWLEQHFADHITVTAWAAAAGLSVRTFERRAEEVWSSSPLARLQRRRLAEARRLLERTHLPFAVITVRAGYEDSPSFRKLFLRELGMSPGEYRRRYRRKA